MYWWRYHCHIFVLKCLYLNLFNGIRWFPTINNYMVSNCGIYGRMDDFLPTQTIVIRRRYRYRLARMASTFQTIPGGEEVTGESGIEFHLGEKQCFCHSEKRVDSISDPITMDTLKTDFKEAFERLGVILQRTPSVLTVSQWHPRGKWATLCEWKTYHSVVNPLWDVDASTSRNV